MGQNTGRQRGLRRLLAASGHSWAGLRAAWFGEVAFRQEVLLGILLLPLALWLGDSGVERALLAGSWLLVMAIELVNSAVEAAIDRIGPERHALSKRAKDVGSAAVLIALLNALLVWLLILFDG